MKEYGEIRHFVPLVAPVDAGNNSWATPYVDLSDVLECTFLIEAGLLTAASTITLTVTVEASSAGTSNASEVQIPFNYRLSSAVGTDSWGAVTAAAASTGAIMYGTASSGKFLLVEVDPAKINALNALGRWVRVVGTKSSTFSAMLYGAVAVLIPRHASASMQSSS